MSHAATRAALAARRASIGEDSAAVAALRLDSWAYAAVARDYLDRAWMLPDQVPADPRVMAAARRVRSHLSPHRGEMVGDQSEALAALDDLGRVLDAVEVTP